MHESHRLFLKFYSSSDFSREVTSQVAEMPESCTDYARDSALESLHPCSGGPFGDATAFVSTMVLWPTPYPYHKLTGSLGWTQVGILFLPCLWYSTCGQQIFVPLSPGEVYIAGIMDRIQVKDILELSGFFFSPTGARMGELWVKPECPWLYTQCFTGKLQLASG